MSYGYDYDDRPRIPVRLLVAIAIAAIGIISYLLQSEINPVTGERQHIALSVDQEMALGLEAAPEMAAKMGGAVPKSDPRSREVAMVGLRLVRSSNAERSPYAGNFHFTLLEDPRTVNAFALPGGQIFITLGLFDRLETEGDLAGVLGHEIGHVIHRHTAQQMAKGQLGQALTNAVIIGAQDERGGGRGVAQAAVLANQMLMLRYGRGDESQADSYGLRAMADAGYNPRRMLHVMEVLKAAGGGGRTPEWASTHPAPESRFREIERELKEMYPDGIPAGLTDGRSLAPLQR